MFAVISVLFFNIYIIRYDKQAVGPADGKRSPSPRDMCNAIEVVYALMIPKGRGKERVEGWDTKRSLKRLE